MAGKLSAIARMTVFAVALLVTAATTQADVPDTIPVDTVWAGHPVGFSLLTHGDQQFVAYYNADRQMTVAQRTLGATDWTYTHLDSHIGWDSHNYVTMVVDDDGYLHLAGNMHGDPLTYFRSAKPLDASTLERVPEMTGRHEQRVTYPRFFRGPNDELIFTYRDGGSGNGVNYYNRYDHAAQQWHALLDVPLLDGEGKMNAYQRGPLPGPDGYFHMVWIWRNTPDCETNHSVSYARSRDLVHWETAAAEPIDLPITLGDGAVVDPVPPGGGAINGNVRIGFDTQHRPIVSYHKYDEAGNTQIYNARFEDGAWQFHQATNWDYRWDFSGRGSIGGFKVRLSAVNVRDGALVQSFRQPNESGTWVLDPETLRPVRRYEPKSKPPPRPKRKLESDFPGMHVRRAGDTGQPNNPNIRYQLTWETLEANRDRPRDKPWPEPSTLKVHRHAAE